MNTKKIVLAGGSNSGKTSLLNFFKTLGHEIIPEFARESHHDPKYSSLIEKEIAIARFRYESAKNANGEREMYFCDRSLIDNYFFSKKFLPEIPREINGWASEIKYDLVFELERMQFVNQRDRLEKDDLEAGKYHSEIMSAYREFGYSPVFIPLVSVEERANIILSHIQKLKGGD